MSGSAYQSSASEQLYASPHKHIYSKPHGRQMTTSDIYQSVRPFHTELPPLLPPPKSFSSKGAPFIPGTTLPIYLPPPRLPFIRGAMPSPIQGAGAQDVRLSSPQLNKAKSASSVKLSTSDIDLSTSGQVSLRTAKIFYKTSISIIIKPNLYVT